MLVFRFKNVQGYNNISNFAKNVFSIKYEMKSVAFLDTSFLYLW